MGMEKVLAISVKALGKMSIRYDDDLIDRASRIYTAWVLFILSVILSSSNYVGKPMKCWSQPYKAMKDGYINTYCWIRNTYYVPIYSEIPGTVPDREERQLSYYQWVPIILLLQALCFILPSWFWRTVSTMSGIDITAILSSLDNIKLFNLNLRVKKITYTGLHIHKSLIFRMKQAGDRHTSALREKLSRISSFCINRRNGNYLFALYLATKMLYLLNLWVQLVVLNWFLDTEYYIYGVDLFMNVVKGRRWSETGKFPRVTYCDFDIRVLGNLHLFTVQCVLPLNLFNEKIYIFVWFWLFFLAIAASINFIKWILKIYFPLARYKLIKRYLTQSGRLAKEHDRVGEKLTSAYLHQFVHEYLRIDGVFLIIMASINTSDITACEIVDELWKLYFGENNKGGGKGHVEGQKKDPNEEKRDKEKAIMPNSDGATKRK